MKSLHKITWIILIIGGINWLLIGLFTWGIGSILPMGLARLIYVLVGISALVELFGHKKNCAECAMPRSGTMPPSNPTPTL